MYEAGKNLILKKIQQIATTILYKDKHCRWYIVSIVQRNSVHFTRRWGKKHTIHTQTTATHLSQAKDENITVFILAFFSLLFSLHVACLSIKYSRRWDRMHKNTQPYSHSTMVFFFSAQKMKLKNTAQKYSRQISLIWNHRKLFMNSVLKNHAIPLTKCVETVFCKMKLLVSVVKWIIEQ